jgi:hypothetical protein
MLMQHAKDMSYSQGGKVSYSACRYRYLCCDLFVLLCLFCSILFFILFPVLFNLTYFIYFDLILVNFNYIPFQILNILICITL